MAWSTVGVVVLLFLAYFLKKIFPRYLKYRALKVIPGPECGFWIGQFLTVFREPFLQPHKIWWKEIVGYDAPVMRYSKFLGDNMIVVLDPEIIKDILMAPVTKNNARFYKPYVKGPLTAIIGNGLVTLEGEEWMQHRRLIQPAFSLSFLKDALGECVPEKVAAFLQYWIDAGSDHEIDVSLHLSALTLDVIGEAGFSYNCNGLADMKSWAAEAVKMQEKVKGGESTSPQLSDPLITSMNALLTPDIRRLILYILGLGKLDPIFNTKTIRVQSAMNNTIDNIIAMAKQKQQQQSNTGESSGKVESTKSLLALLLQNEQDSDSTGGDSKKPAVLSDLELRDEIKTFLFAGHETTSTWCTWAMFALAKYPDVQEKLYQDVMLHAPKDIIDNISLDQVDSMEYLAVFLQEVLRLYPPVGLTLRNNRYEEKIAGYTIPKDTTLCVPVHLMHRHPKYWEDPELFSPERWMKCGGMDNRGFTFLPFGAGGHNCIGYRFATYEAKLIMAHMVRALRIEIAPSQRDVEHTFTSSVTMKAKPGLKVVVKPRKVV